MTRQGVDQIEFERCCLNVTRVQLIFLVRLRFETLGRCSRKGTFPAILEYILRHFINQNRTGLEVSHLKPVQALIHCKETYENEYKAQFPIADELMSPDSKIKQRFSALKTKFAKDRMLEKEFPAQPSEQ